jgi:hypothetical protein
MLSYLTRKTLLSHIFNVCLLFIEGHVDLDLRLLKEVQPCENIAPFFTQNKHRICGERPSSLPVSSLAPI